MKRFLLILLTIISISLCIGCKDDKEKDNKPNTEEPKSYELIADNRFECGFTAAPANKTISPDNRWPLSYDFKYLDQSKATIGKLVSMAVIMA